MSNAVQVTEFAKTKICKNNVAERSLAATNSSSILLPKADVIFLGLFLAFLQAADGILTSIGVGRFGLTVEGNPILRGFMEEFGYIPTLAWSKLFAIVIVLSLTMATTKLPWVKKAIGAMTCIYFFAAILPWTYILFISPYI